MDEQTTLIDHRACNWPRVGGALKFQITDSAFWVQNICMPVDVA